MSDSLVSSIISSGINKRLIQILSIKTLFKLVMMDVIRKETKRNTKPFLWQWELSQLPV